MADNDFDLNLFVKDEKIEPQSKEALRYIAYPGLARLFADEP